VAANQLKNATTNQKTVLVVGGVFKKRPKQGRWQQGWWASNGDKGNGDGDGNGNNLSNGDGNEAGG
jgi:hypothetical protein